MRDDVFHAKGYNVGYVATECACKHVVGQLLKRSGMIWSKAGLPARLSLLINWLNKRRDKL